MVRSASLCPYDSDHAVVKINDIVKTKPVQAILSPKTEITLNAIILHMCIIVINTVVYINGIL